MEQQEKNPYSKPMIVFENFSTGELTGSPEMIARIQADCARLEAEHPTRPCPFSEGTLPCFMRGGSNV